MDYSLLPRERIDLKKQFLKRLPIWAPLENVGVELAKLEYDVKNVETRFQEISDEVDRLPKITTEGKRRFLPCKQHLNHDVVKVYHRGRNGEIIIKDDDQEKKQSIKEQRSVEQLRKPPQSGDLVFARVNENGPWLKCKIKSVFHKVVNDKPMTTFRLITLDDNKTVSVGKYEVARIQDHGDQMRSCKRVVAGDSETTMEPGIIGYDPNPGVNRNRYMVFLDSGSCRYFKLDQVYPLFYQSYNPWRDLILLGNRDKLYIAELNQYFRHYPLRRLLHASPGQKITMMNAKGINVEAVITNIDCDIMTVTFKDGSEETIHRSCPRLTKTLNQVSQLLKDNICIDKLHPILVGNMRRYHDAGSMALGELDFKFLERFTSAIRICGGSNTARKSTSTQTKPPRVRVRLDAELVPDERDELPLLDDLVKVANQHRCSSDCLVIPDSKTEASIGDIIAEFRDTADIKVPLLLGWRRILVKHRGRKGKGNKLVVYQAPCGRICRDALGIRRYIQGTGSKFDVDYFTFDKEVIFNRQLGERVVYHYKPNIAVNQAGECLENKFISLANPVNEEELPLDFEYRNHTFPHPMLEAKGFSFNLDFKSGCDCEDDCFVRASCACHQLTEEAAGINAHHRGQVDPKSQYSGKRLGGQVATGIFECNSFCNCSSKCPNRVVQNGIRIRMQVRKTIDKGWGVFVLDDVPKGTFICTYSAELLDDADQYGDSDMYYADLDYISVVEEQKLSLTGEEERSDEGVDTDEDTTKPRSKSKKRPIVHESGESSADSSGSSIQFASQEEFMPQAEVRYPKRTRAAIVRKVSSNAQERQHFRKIHKILNETQDYTLDARMQGNIGRFFNHSCDPNTLVQNVFIETHDLRFPVVAFFAKRALRADEEINWHYNYKIDSIAGRRIPCNCGAPNCQGRIL